jgi:hypothetical protein
MTRLRTPMHVQKLGDHTFSVHTKDQERCSMVQDPFRIRQPYLNRTVTARNAILHAFHESYLTYLGMLHSMHSTDRISRNHACYMLYTLQHIGVRVYALEQFQLLQRPGHKRRRNAMHLIKVAGTLCQRP